MRCASCDKAVDDFKLLTPMDFGSVTKAKSTSEKDEDEAKETKSEDVPSQEQNSVELVSAKDESEMIEAKPRTRTPSIRSVSGETSEALAVLRIDNVPWVCATTRILKVGI